jgi:hypothetical protein
MTLQNHRRLPVKIAALGSLKQVTGRIFKFSKKFQNEQKIVKTYQRMYRKYLFVIISLQNNYLSRGTITYSLLSKPKVSVTHVFVYTDTCGVANGAYLNYCTANHKQP